ncbi:MAG: hypothetical protein MJE68_17945 [Proteobacteria bacterium]|nr:hypothetical protein [Pseudomonadota bacterium]
MEVEKSKQAETPQLLLQPKVLNFSTPVSATRRRGQLTSTPQMLPPTPSTPASERFSDVESLSSENTSVTPDMSNLSLGKKRGRPRKELVQPSMDDFPYGASEAEQKKYIRKKNTEFWRYQKLSGKDSASYRQSELERVKMYHKKKKEQLDADKSEETDSDHQKKLGRER